MAAPIDYTPVRNTTDEVIPSGGLLRVTGIDADTGAFLVGLPDADDDPAVGVNGLGLIPAGAAGQGHFDPRAIAAYDAADGTPQPGEAWGVKAGDWRLRKGYAGFRVLAGVGLGLVNVVRVPAGASGDSACDALDDLLEHTCVEFVVGATVVVGRWQTDYGVALLDGWVGADPITTGDGETTLVLDTDDFDRPILRMIGETTEWFLRPAGCVGTARRFKGRYTPLGMDAGSGSGSGSGCCGPCPDNTLTVLVRCRDDHDTYTGCDALPETPPTCLTVTDSGGTSASYDIGSPALQNFLVDNSYEGVAAGTCGEVNDEYTPVYAQRCGWIVGADAIGFTYHVLHELQIYYEPGACGGDGAWVWSWVTVNQSEGTCTPLLVPAEPYFVLNDPDPADDPWELVLGPGMVLSGTAPCTPDPPAYDCDGSGNCVETVGGPYDEPTCGGNCTPEDTHYCYTVTASTGACADLLGAAGATGCLDGAAYGVTGTGTYSGTCPGGGTYTISVTSGPHPAPDCAGGACEPDPTPCFFVGGWRPCGQEDSYAAVFTYSAAGVYNLSAVPSYTGSLRVCADGQAKVTFTAGGGIEVVYCCTTFSAANSTNTFALESETSCADAPASFVLGTSDPGNCELTTTTGCEPCGSGSGSGDDDCCTGAGEALETHPDLNLDIPDGPDAGTYTLTWDAGFGRYEGVVGGDNVYLTCNVVLCGASGFVLTREGTGDVCASELACSPFGAVFLASALFGSTGDVTVTVA